MHRSKSKQFTCSVQFSRRINGILCIIVTDRDGTPVIRATSEIAPGELGLATKPTFLATFTMATDQASKLGLGKNQSIVCMYSNYQVCLQSQYHFSMGAVNMHAGEVSMWTRVQTEVQTLCFSMHFR